MTLAPPAVKRTSFHIALLDRGWELRYRTSWALLGAAFRTLSSAAFTTGRTRGGTFSSWSVSEMSEAPGTPRILAARVIGLRDGLPLARMHRGEMDLQRRARRLELDAKVLVV